MGTPSGHGQTHIRGFMRLGIGGHSLSGENLAKWKDRMEAWVRAPGAAPWNIFLPPDFPETQTVEWRGPGAEAGRGPLSELPEAARRASIRVWTPAIETLLTVAQWPGRGRGRLAQALPYLLEEQLLADPETLAFSHRDTEAGIFVAVTAKERLSAWRAVMEEERLDVTFCPVTLALPWRPRTWSCRFADGQWAVRTGPYSGFGAAGLLTQIPAAFRQALTEAVKAKAVPDSITLFGGDEALRALIARESGLSVIADARPIGEGETPGFRLGETGGAVSASGLAALRALRPALVALALVLALGFARTVFDWVRLSHEEARVNAEMTSIFTANFPNAPVLDPARQMRQGVAKLAARAGGAGQGFLAVLTDAGPALAGLAQGALTRLEYRHGAVRCAVRLANFDALTALKHHLMRNGLSVQITHVMSHQGGVQALVTMTRRSP
ncbi:MAG: type II secretion system protein GspL [Acidiferrobacter sp.]